MLNESLNKGKKNFLEIQLITQSIEESKQGILFIRTATHK